jgi:hypothetical protein
MALERDWNFGMASLKNATPFQLIPFRSNAFGMGFFKRDI